MLWHPLCTHQNSARRLLLGEAPSRSQRRCFTAKPAWFESHGAAPRLLNTSAGGRGAARSPAVPPHCRWPCNPAICFSSAGATARQTGEPIRVTERLHRPQLAGQVGGESRSRRRGEHGPNSPGTRPVPGQRQGVVQSHPGTSPALKCKGRKICYVQVVLLWSKANKVHNINWLQLLINEQIQTKRHLACKSDLPLIKCTKKIFPGIQGCFCRV